jgi:hypothetical protein
MQLSSFHQHQRRPAPGEHSLVYPLLHPYTPMPSATVHIPQLGVDAGLSSHHVYLQHEKMRRLENHYEQDLPQLPMYFNQSRVELHSTPSCHFTLISICTNQRLSPAISIIPLLENTLSSPYTPDIPFKTHTQPCFLFNCSTSSRSFANAAS